MTGAVTATEGARVRIQALLERVLRFSPDWDDPHVGFRRLPEWGSLQHIQILAALHVEFGVGQRPGDIDLLVSPRAILRAVTGDAEAERVPGPFGVEVDRGLAHTYLDETRITDIDVAASRLAYRGHDVAELAHQCSYESVARLLIDDQLLALDDERLALMSEGALLTRTAGLVWDGSHTDLLACLAGVPSGAAPPVGEAAARRHGWRVLGAVAQLATRSTSPLPAGDGLTAAICRSLTNQGDAAAAANSLMILQADHGASAAALAVRTAISAGASLHHAIIAGMATFGGNRHGGAISEVVALVESCAGPAELRRRVRALLAAGTPVPGFGHRIYRTRDPRVAPIHQLLMAAEERQGSTWWSDRLRVIRAEHDDLERSGAVANVDFYAGPLMRLLGFETRSLTPLFAIARMPGWIAHATEQVATRTLIRPRLHYVGVSCGISVKPDAKDNTP